jgi:hypothetical protein
VWCQKELNCVGVDFDGSETKKAAKSRFSVLNKTLAMTYFHMRRPHTIIGACLFHF